VTVSVCVCELLFVCVWYIGFPIFWYFHTDHDSLAGLLIHFPQQKLTATQCVTKLAHITDCIIIINEDQMEKINTYDTKSYTERIIQIIVLELRTFVLKNCVSTFWYQCSQY